MHEEAVVHATSVMASSYAQARRQSRPVLPVSVLQSRGQGRDAQNTEALSLLRQLAYEHGE